MIGDGALDATRPEILVLEPRGDRLRLAGVEYIVIAEDWHATNEAPPVPMGQRFHYVGRPNPHGLPPFYELQVWSWKPNPNRMFIGNPLISCEDYDGDEVSSATGRRRHGQ